MAALDAATHAGVQHRDTERHSAGVARNPNGRLWPAALQPRQLTEVDPERVTEGSRGSALFADPRIQGTLSTHDPGRVAEMSQPQGNASATPAGVERSAVHFPGVGKKRRPPATVCDPYRGHWRAAVFGYHELWKNSLRRAKKLNVSSAEWNRDRVLRPPRCLRVSVLNARAAVLYDPRP